MKRCSLHGELLARAHCHSAKTKSLPHFWFLGVGVEVLAEPTTLGIWAEDVVRNGGDTLVCNLVGDSWHGAASRRRSVVHLFACVCACVCVCVYALADMASCFHKKTKYAHVKNIGCCRLGASLLLRVCVCGVLFCT